MFTVALSLALLLAPVSAPPGQSPRPLPPGADAGPAVVYQPPVVAPVVDPFRPPADPYAAGNRGLEYATAAGTTVGAAADGQVVFAGPVAGSLHVTVLHADGIRTSYSFLQEVLVATGQHVARGQLVGVTGNRLHVGARTGPRQYLDPASLWGGPPHVHLVPVAGDGSDRGGTTASAERRDLGDVAGHPAPTAALAGGMVQLGATRPLR